MRTEYVGLWQKVDQFQIDVPTVSLPFSKRLARENRWEPAFALRAIAEYKKFAFLAIVAGYPVSPPEIVDQVWHLHLTYTRNYWREFCGEVLGKPLHHHPTEGGPGERAKFDDWYRKTLETYREVFGKEPPADIWLSPDRKQSAAGHAAWVDLKTHWVIPKFRFRLGLNRTLVLVALIGAAGLAAGCTILSGPPAALNFTGPDFLRFYFTWLPICLLLAGAMRWMLRIPGGGLVSQRNLDPYEVAYLNGGPILAVNTAIATLVDQRVATADATSRSVVVNGEIADDAHAIERVIHQSAGSFGQSIGGVRLAASGEVENIRSRLAREGLALTPTQSRLARFIPLIVALLMPIFGVIKIIIGLLRGRPVGFLVAASIISAILVIAVFGRTPVRSRRGDKALKAMRTRHVTLRRLPRFLGAMPPAEFALAVGLFGLTALNGTTLASLQKTLRPLPQNMGGDGGGCGGCGGWGGD